MVSFRVFQITIPEILLIMEFCENSGISGHLLQFFDENAVFQQEN